MRSNKYLVFVLIIVLIASCLLSNFLGSSPSGGGYFLVLTLLAALVSSMLLLSALLWTIVYAIKVKPLRISVMVLFYVLFLPIMLLVLAFGCIVKA